MEFGESAEEAIAREMKEETSLNIVSDKPYSTFSYISDNGFRHTIDIQFIVEVDNINDLKISQSHDDLKWISEEEINEYLISDLMKTAIEKGFKSLK